MGGQRWRDVVVALGCVATVCLLLLAGCGQGAASTATAPAGTPTGAAAAASAGVAASPATPATVGPPPRIANADGTPRPWSASPTGFPALAQTPTPLVCPTPDPRNATAAATVAEGTCQDLFLFPPSAPAQVVAVATGGAIEVQWRTAGGGGTHFEIYRQVAPRGAWARLASVAADPDREALGRTGRDTPYAWRDEAAVLGTTYRYTVAKVSAYGRRSNNTQASLPITAP